MTQEKTPAELLQYQLCYQKENQWKHADEAFEAEVMEFNRSYANALNVGKTEREFYSMSVKKLEENGFRDLNTLESVKAGDKVYSSVHDKGLVAAVVGTEPASKGYVIVGSHIDSPRLDLKPNALYEKDEMAFFKTHYYGGIKKYQWLSTQLALHGVVITKDGKKIEVSIGEDAEDPVFTIPDLLPHLGRKQMANKASEVVEAEAMNILLGSKPIDDEKIKEPVKLAILKLLHDKYGITERDLYTAELEIVPAHKARDVGFDRSFIGAYGQDDRVCAWTSLEAILDAKPQAKTQVILFSDKEEVGSAGNTGAKSELYYFALYELQQKILGREATLMERHDLIRNSKMLSSDVAAGFDPDFADVYEPMNAAHMNYGIAFCKYTGGGGKGGTSDASAEYFNEITRLFDSQNIPWQSCELGKTDAGGGGTIAQFFANSGMNVIDCGVAVLAMHSCFEICSKLDIYNTYRAYKAFFERG